MAIRSGITLEDMPGIVRELLRLAATTKPMLKSLFPVRRCKKIAAAEVTARTRVFFVFGAIVRRPLTCDCSRWAVWRMNPLGREGERLFGPRLVGSGGGVKRPIQYFLSHSVWGDPR